MARAKQPAAVDAQGVHGETAPLLEVRDLHTHLTTKAGVVKAVDGVSFYLRAGETLGIVGESGSGKSMTARSILGMEPKPAAEIVAGEVLLDGENLLTKTEEEMREVRGKRISMILQDPQTSLNPVFTVGNQIMEAVRIHDRRSDRKTLHRRVVDLLRQVNVAAPEKRVGDYPHEMSGGMKQRVVGAIAISSEPDIIIADEPTTSLDLTIQAQYLRLLREIQERTGAAIIFITHDFGIVARMCDRVAVMYAGRMVEQGDVRAIFNTPSHPYTHALINSVPQVEKRVERLFSIPGQPPMPGMEVEGCPFADRCAYADERCTQEHPPEFAGRSGKAGHTAECWRLEDPSWQPNPYSA
jgi:oligopeptide/dipeptide ABC transporter ATP-binding protein